MVSLFSESNICSCLLWLKRFWACFLGSIWYAWEIYASILSTFPLPQLKRWRKCRIIFNPTHKIQVSISIFNVRKQFSTLIPPLETSAPILKKKPICYCNPYVHQTSVSKLNRKPTNLVFHKIQLVQTSFIWLIIASQS